MNLQEISTELGAFFRVNQRAVEAVVYGRDIQLNKYAKKITKVKGKYPAIHSVISSVVQGFTTTWNEVGAATFKVNELVAFHQKVNFPIIPHEVEATWLAELSEENASLQDKSISRHIWNELLMPKVLDDVDYLSGKGVYDANNLGVFGKSMNGLVSIIAAGVANATNPMFRIPLNTLTPTNIVDEVTTFEQKIPSKLKSYIKIIFMSESNAELYRLDYENTFGANTNYTAEKGMKSRLGSRTIVGLRCLNGTDLIFGTVDGNLLQLIDTFDRPEVTDVQTLDYKVKIFMEWWLGYGFYVNQLVVTSNYDDSVWGLGSAALNTLYFTDDAAALNATNGSGSAN